MNSFVKMIKIIATKQLDIYKADDLQNMLP